MIFRRGGRFGDLVGRQLDMFEDEHAELLRRCTAAVRAYDAADRDEAEERFGDYHDLVDEVTEHLAELRDGYARTLGEPEAEEYATAFNRAVRRRLPRFTVELDGS